jgi:hypothetical protein
MLPMGGEGEEKTEGDFHFVFPAKLAIYFCCFGLLGPEQAEHKV